MDRRSQQLCPCGMEGEFADLEKRLVRIENVGIKFYACALNRQTIQDIYVKLTQFNAAVESRGERLDHLGAKNRLYSVSEPDCGYKHCHENNKKASCDNP